MERPPLTDLPDVAREYIAYQDQQIAMLQQRIENLTNMLLNLQKRQFGAKSENTLFRPRRASSSACSTRRRQRPILRHWIRP